MEKRKYGIFAEVNLVSIGYDGRYIDASVSFVGVGFVFGFEKEKLRVKVDPPGTPGLDISIDVGQLVTDIYGYRRCYNA